MLYDDEFFDTMPDNPHLAGRAICQRFFEFDRATPDELENFDIYLEAYAVAQALSETFGFGIKEVPLIGDKQEVISKIRDQFGRVYDKVDRVATEYTFQQAKNRLVSKFGGVFAYTFSDGDLSRIQTLINELRTELSSSTFFSPEHKERLFKRLGSLQLELHKRVPSLDKFWGLVGEAGVALGKFGVDAKPFADRIKEVLEIVWRTQARTEELESGSPLPLIDLPPK